MAITETIMSPGSWSVTLSPDTPRTILDALQYFQHIVISTGRHNPQLEGSSLFTSGRFTGVITGLDFSSKKANQGIILSGDTMATWLGNGSGVGPVIEGNNTPGSSGNGAQFTSAAYSTVVNTLVGVSSLKVGTIYSMPTSATYTGGFIWTTVAKALTSFATQITQGALPTQIAEWRANGNATVDFGPVASLYRTSPITAIVPNNPGMDMSIRGLDGVAELIEDVKDYTTRTVVLASGSGAATAVGAANIGDVGGTNPYTDFYGNPIVMTRTISASGVSSVNATVSAQAALIPYTTPADQVRLSSTEYDIKGDLVCGDYVWLYDPDAGFIDTSGANEIVFRGERINPTKQRVIQVNWPVTSDMTVAYRDQHGNWYDLTDYVQFEDGTATNLTVGGYNRNLVSTSEPTAGRPNPDTTIPGVPVFGAHSTTVYQSSSDGRTRAQIQINWSTPSNTDGTTMIDLDHYEIQYRPDLGIFATNPSYNALQSAGYTYNALNALGGTYKQLIPQAVSNWKVTFVAGGVNTLLIQELTPGVNYDFQIRAVDTANPPNNGAWSATTTIQASADTIPPPTPDAPTVATNMASVQVTWDCGTSDGGTFTQAVDLHHVEVHGSYDPLFTPSNATKLGNLPANIGNITGQIPVVGSFTIPPGQPPAQAMFIRLIAVDEAGNKSNPSVSAGSTATLWSNAYITDLTVSKLTAGTVTASIIMAGQITTGLTGQRVLMDSTGFHAYDSSGNLTFDVNSNSAVITLGKTGQGNKITIDMSTQVYPTIYLWDQTGTGPAFINAVEFGASVGAGIGINTAEYTSSFDSSQVGQRIYLSGPPIGGVFQVIDINQAIHGGSFSVTDSGATMIVGKHGAQDGGEISMSRTSALYGLFPSGATHGGQLLMKYNSGAGDVSWELDGYRANAGSVAPQTQEAEWGGEIGSISGTGLTWSYGTTMFSTPTPVAVPRDINTTTIPAWMMTTSSTTGFGLIANASYTGLFSVMFWAFRWR